MTDYKIIRKGRENPTEALELLEEEVNKHLAEGWTALGGPAVITGKSLFFACQAIVKIN